MSAPFDWVGAAWLSAGRVVAALMLYLCIGPCGRFLSLDSRRAAPPVG
ncbi:MAG: hypothetical protein R3286_13980 [Gammaproteobacteria bacterium]|nr:hypothetical protein [Gammaproteobacteria bacterium]